MEERHLGASKGRQPTQAKDFGSPHGLSGKHIPIFPNLFRVIVIFATQMKFMDCSFHVKYRRQAGLESISWRGRDVTSLKLHELCWQGWNNFALRSLVKGDMRAYFLLAPSKHSCLSYAEVPGKQG